MFCYECGSDRKCQYEIPCTTIIAKRDQEGKPIIAICAESGCNNPSTKTISVMGIPMVICDDCSKEFFLK